MQTCHNAHIKTLLTHVVVLAKPFTVFDCLYVNGIFGNWETGLVSNLHVFKCEPF